MFDNTTGISFTASSVHLLVVLFHSDLPPHFKSSAVAQDLVLEITRNVTKLLKDTFPNIPILPVIGNHDYFPKNQIPGDRTPFYDVLADMWAPWFNDTEITEKFKHGKSVYFDVKILNYTECFFL